MFDVKSERIMPGSRLLKKGTIPLDNVDAGVKPDRERFLQPPHAKGGRMLITGAAIGSVLAVGLVLFAVFHRGDTPPRVGGTTEEAAGERVVPRDDGDERGRLGEGETTRTTAQSPGLPVSQSPGLPNSQSPPRIAEERATSKTTKEATSIEDLVKPHERGIVWIGFELRDFVFPHGTGWLVRSDRVVTTASVVADLEPLLQDGIEVVVWSAGRVVPVKTVHRHPAYDAENPGSQASVHSNLGLVMLEESVEPVCPVAPAAEIGELTQSSALLAVGFDSRLGKNEPFDELKVNLFRNKAELLKSELMASTSTRVYTLHVPTPKCCDGAPIFNERGHVVGVLAVVSGEAKMVPVSQLSKLLEASPGRK